MSEEKKKKTAAQQRATAKYEAANYDKILVRLPKGTKEKIKVYSDSINGFINTAIHEKLIRAETEKQIAEYDIRLAEDPDAMPFS